ncbi:MAG: hypothetical protein LBT05_01540 [Planctomycetaceae bacterium]|nr:hypothetical protein [Planctomycetaceae bacterium]
MKTQHNISLFFFVLLTIIGYGVCGCSSPVSTRKIEFYNPFLVNRPHRAAKMTGLWEAKQRIKKSGSIRGFQGEIIFFRDEKMEKSTAVDGTLTVYLFNSDKSVGENRNIDGIQPEGAYTFDSNTLRKSVEKNKKSKLISYGVWLPYDQAPGDEKNFVILAKFEGKEEDGELIFSDQIPIHLPGRPVAAKSEKNVAKTIERSEIQPVGDTVSVNGFDGFNAIRHADYNDSVNFNGVQMTAYGEAVQRLQSGMNAAEISRSSDKLMLPPSVLRQILQTPQNSDAEKNKNSSPFHSEKTSTLPDEIRTPAIGFGGGDAANTYSSSNDQRFAALGFGNGAPPANAPNNQYAANPAPYRNSLPEEMSPERLTRFRPNVTGIGTQINQRMQEGLYADRRQSFNNAATSPANFNNDEIQQVSYVATNPQTSATQTAKRQEMHQAMARMMMEQEQRRNWNQANPLGFSNYNANTFPTDQSRVTVTDRYPSWGMIPSQTERQANQFSPNQIPNTLQSSYVESEWGSALEGVSSSRETQVFYSPTVRR